MPTEDTKTPPTVDSAAEMKDTVIPHDIRWGIEQMREGKFVSRAGWNGKGLRIGLQVRDDESVNTEPYVYMLMPDADVAGAFHRVPWTCSQTDLLAHDWDVI